MTLKVPMILILEQQVQLKVNSNDYTKVWLQLAQWFLRRRLKCEMLMDG
jgi:hypothetical protein